MNLPKDRLKGFFAFCIVSFLLIAIWTFFSPKDASEEPKDLAFNEFITAVETDSVKSIEIRGMNIIGEFKDGKRFFTFKEYGYEITPLLLKHKVAFKSVYEKENWWAGILTNFIVIALVIGGVLIFIKYMGRQQSAGYRGKAGFKEYNANKQSKVTFADVAGIDEAKEELTEIVSFLRHEGDFGKLGGRVPKGALLMGSPGTGKTLLARAVAGEAGASFFSMAGSEFVEMFVGVGASRVRELFDKARKSTPAVIFIDEVDAVGKHRGAGIGQNHNENEQTLNQILKEMDGFSKDAGIIVLAATNRPDVLDPALLRPGRFDRQVVVPLPDLKGRFEILKVHVRNKIVSESVDLMIIARGTPGASGADIENLCNEAALLAEKNKKKAIEQSDFEEAFEKILMGKTKPTIMSEKVKRGIAVHEAGHTIINLLCPNIDPFFKVSIIPRGRSLGVTVNLPTEDKFLQTKQEIEEEALMFLGGRAAEAVVLGEICTGASNDLARVTALIKDMVGKYGMDEENGLAAFSGDNANPFLGLSMGLHEGTSPQTQYNIEQRVSVLLKEYYGKTMVMINHNKDKLIALVEALLKEETLDAKQVKEIVGELS